MTNLCGNILLPNDFMNTFCEIQVVGEEGRHLDELDAGLANHCLGVAQLPAQKERGRERGGGGREGGGRGGRE